MFGATKMRKNGLRKKKTKEKEHRMGRFSRTNKCTTNVHEKNQKCWAQCSSGTKALENVDQVELKLKTTRFLLIFEKSQTSFSGILELVNNFFSFWNLKTRHSFAAIRGLKCALFAVMVFFVRAEKSAANGRGKYMVLVVCGRTVESSSKLHIIAFSWSKEGESKWSGCKAKC